MNQPIDRRSLIVKTIKNGVSISLSPALFSCQSTSQASPATYESLYLQVTDSNEFIFTFDKVEMGQGVITGQATLFGEEANIHPDQFIFKPAPPDKKFAKPGSTQITAGSSSTKTRWKILREAGAMYRQSLIEAAAKEWNTFESEIQTLEGYVFTKDKKRKTSYASLSHKLKEPKEFRLKDPEEYKYIGRFSKSVDASEKSNGKAVYAIDENIENQKRAFVLRAPVHGASLKTVEIDKIKALSGVVDVLLISTGVAVVCDHYYQCLKARQNIQDDWLDWQIPETIKYDSAKLFSEFNKKLPPKASFETKEQSYISATYELPFLAHAPMEPQNCIAWLHAGILEIWAPTQAPQITQSIGARLSGLNPENVRVHVAKYMGGGFGRRTNDSIIDAVELAILVDYPVQVIWSREDDMHHSALRPMAVTKLEAIHDNTKILKWKYQTVSLPMLQDVIKENFPYISPSWLPYSLSKTIANSIASGMKLFDMMPIAIDGASQPYDIPYDNETIQVDLEIPTYFWRSVGSSLNGFFIESFVDELSESMKIDPLELRTSLLKDRPRAKATIERVCSMAGWKNRAKSSSFYGLAYHYSYETHCAQIAEIENHNSGGFRIKKIYTVVDCGQVVNPHIVIAQVRSAIIYGLSAILFGEISFKEGRVEQHNFDSYPILRLSQTPDLVVDYIRNHETPTGIGEPGLPAVAAAVCNALYAATGRRIRKLPIKNQVEIT